MVYRDYACPKSGVHFTKFLEDVNHAEEEAERGSPGIWFITDGSKGI